MNVKPLTCCSVLCGGRHGKVTRRYSIGRLSDDGTNLDKTHALSRSVDFKFIANSDWSYMCIIYFVCFTTVLYTNLTTPWFISVINDNLGLFWIYNYRLFPTAQLEVGEKEFIFTDGSFTPRNMSKINISVQQFAGSSIPLTTLLFIAIINKNRSEVWVDIDVKARDKEHVSKEILRCRFTY